MPRLRSSLGLSDARRAIAVGPRVQGRRAAEAALGVRRAFERTGQVDDGAALRAVRVMRRSARAGRLFDQLAARLKPRAPQRGLCGIFRSRLAALYAKVAVTIAACWMAFASPRSMVSMV